MMEKSQGEQMITRERRKKSHEGDRDKWNCRTENANMAINTKVYIFLYRLRHV